MKAKVKNYTGSKFFNMWKGSHILSETGHGSRAWIHNKVRKAMLSALPETAYQFSIEWSGGDQNAGIFIAAVTSPEGRAVVRGFGNRAEVCREV